MELTSPSPFISKAAEAPRENERIKVAVRIRPLHPRTELGHDNIVTIEPNLRTLRVKSGIYHDMRSTYDTLLPEYNEQH